MKMSRPRKETMLVGHWRYCESKKVCLLKRGHYRLAKFWGEAESFGRHLEAEGCGPQMLQSNLGAVWNLVGFLSDSGMDLLPANVDKKILTEYLKFMEAKSYTGATKSSNWSKVTCFFEFLVETEEGVVRSNPFWNLAFRGKRNVLNRKRCYTDQAIKDLQQVWLVSDQPFREAVLLALLALTGIRREECAGIMIENLNLKDSKFGPWLLIRGKNRHERRVPLPDVFARILCIYVEKLGELPKGAYLFHDAGDPLTRVNIDKYLARVNRKLYGKDSGYGCIALRRGLISHLFEQGMKPEEIKGLVDHQDLRTTSEYLVNTSGAIKKSVIRYHPRLFQES